MAYRVELTARAGQDLRHIYRRIHARDSEQAFAWFNGLTAMIYSLGENPARGAIPPANKKLRQLFYGNKPHIYRIIYRAEERAKKVIVLHIRHGARNEFNAEKTRRT